MNEKAHILVPDAPAIGAKETHVVYKDGKEEVVVTEGEFAFHPLGFLVLRKPLGQPPLLIALSEIAKFWQR